jgi:hypothetical protein
VKERHDIGRELAAHKFAFVFELCIIDMLVEAKEPKWLETLHCDCLSFRSGNNKDKRRLRR